MNKIIMWFKTSNRWKHLLGGLLIGMGANAALELKDRQWGGKWDWTDFGLTTAGTVVGQCIRMMI